LPVGNVKYSKEQLEENLKAALGAIFRAKPSTAKGKYLVSITLSSTMGPGVRIDPNLVPKFVE
jgi:large subunit ribosomal protein L1